MGLGDLTRVKTNISAMEALSSLQKTNGELGMRQQRLATGSRINRAEDDSAGYSISKKLEAKTRGQAQAIANIGDAKSLLTVGEGALNTVMDILQTMKEKAVQAANDTLGSEERTAISNQLSALRSEIADVFDTAEFNGKDIFDATGDTDFVFQVGAEKGDNFRVTVAATSDKALLGSTETLSNGAMSVASASAYGLTLATASAGWQAGTSNASALSVNYTGSDAGRTYAVAYDDTNKKLNYGYTSSDGTKVSGSVAFDPAKYSAGDTVKIGDDLEISFNDADKGGAGNFATAMTANTGRAFKVAASTAGSLNVDDHANASNTLSKIDAAIKKVSEQLGGLGDSQKRLTFKQENVQTSMTNYEAARARIADADFAQEQMQIVKLQILQQTGTATLAQANSAPQSVLSLF